MGAHNMKLKNNDAQMQLLEVILVAGMLFVALYFVRGIDIVSNTNVESDNKLQDLGNSILESLSAQSSSYSYYNSLLAYYADYDNGGFANYVRAVLPEGTIFKITSIDMTNLTKNIDATISSSTETIYDPDLWLGEEARASRLVVIGDRLYDIVLYMWFNTGV